LTTLRGVNLDDVLAREAIRDLVARYNSYGDSGRFEPLFELFADDAVMETGDGGGALDVYDGLDAIKGIFIGAQERVTGHDSDVPAYIRHFTATHQIDLVDADHAAGRLYFAVLMDGGLDHWGRYIDRYVRREGTWLFERRRVIVDGHAATSWFAS
jgi:hypothetical protein